jgi:hypothetical protein
VPKITFSDGGLPRCWIHYRPIAATLWHLYRDRNEWTKKIRKVVPAHTSSSDWKRVFILLLFYILFIAGMRGSTSKGDAHNPHLQVPRCQAFSGL